MGAVGKAVGVCVGVCAAVAGLGALGLAGAAGVSLVRAEAERGVYRERLRALNEDYAALAGRYNEAVRRTAVTELLVEGPRIEVLVRTAAGELSRTAVEVEPGSEVYIDYVVLRGRVWLRRVFDEQTPPSLAAVLDPGLAEVDWESPEASFGQAVYRALSDGRWLVEVSGAGGLSLREAGPRERASLPPPPEVVGFGEVEAEAARQGEEVGLREVLARLLGLAG